MLWKMTVLMTGASMTRIVLVSQKSGRSIFERRSESLLLLSLLSVLLLPDQPEIVLDSAPLPPQFRFPDVVVPSSGIPFVIATQRSLLASINVGRRSSQHHWDRMYAGE